MISGMKLLLRSASPRSGSATMSSLALKKSAAPSKRDGNGTGQLKIQSRSRKMFITFGAVEATRISAGLDAALMMRWLGLGGIENMDPRCHSNVCGLA